MSESWARLQCSGIRQLGPILGEHSLKSLLELGQPPDGQPVVGRSEVVLHYGPPHRDIGLRRIHPDSGSSALHRHAPKHAEGDLHVEIRSFLTDRQARGLSPRTIDFYREKLSSFRDYLLSEGIRNVEAITAPILRMYLLHLARTHNAGGVHAAYRALRAFLRWYEEEHEPERWANPLRRVRAPRVPLAPLEPVPISDVQAMIRTCQRRTFFGDRDRAVLLCLLDTGARAAEFLAMNLGDVELGTGQILVLSGKGAKHRMVFIGSKSRRALGAYLHRFQGRDADAPVWVTRQGRRLSYTGLRDIVRRRASRAAIPVPTLHSFRRAFALACLRGGMDVFSLQRLMGHADLTILRRYLAQTSEDIRKAHQRSGPVDRLI